MNQSSQSVTSCEACFVGTGGTLEWPLWLHPTAAGELAFQYVLYYEPATPVEGMKYR